MRVIDGNPWPSTIDTRTVDNILLILQMTIIYTYRHPDFIHIVNNFSGSEMHRPSLTTRNSKFNSIISTSWAVAASLIESAAHGREPAVKQVINDGIANVLAFIHDELGEREICGGCKSKTNENKNDILCPNNCFSRCLCEIFVGFPDKPFPTRIPRRTLPMLPLCLRCSPDSWTSRINRGAVISC